MNQGSRRKRPTNCDISRAEVAAWIDVFGIRALTIALQRERAFYAQALELSCLASPRRRTARARRIARRYAPRGPQKVELIEALLGRVAARIDGARTRECPADMIKVLSLASLDRFGATAFYASNELQPGDARR